MSPEEELRFLILGAQREGNRLLTELLSPLGVTPSQSEVISCLSAGGEMSLNRLGKLLVCETGSPSRLVDTLVGRKIVERSARFIGVAGTGPRSTRCGGSRGGAPSCANAWAVHKQPRARIKGLWFT